MKSLEAQLLAAHAAGDQWGLVELYAQAADGAEEQDAAYFFLTQSYIYGLELNHPLVPDLHKRLRSAGRI